MMTIAQDYPDTSITRVAGEFYPDEPPRNSVPMEVLLGGISRWIPVIVIAMSVAALLMVLWLKFLAVPSYTAQMTVSAFVDPSGGGGTSGSGSLGGISSLLGEGKNGNPNFNLYLQTRKSIVVADELLAIPSVRAHFFKGQWDGEHAQWRPPHGPLADVRQAIKSFFGFPGWTPPDASDLQKLLGKKVKLAQDQQTSSYTFTYSDHDPAFAVMLLEQIHEMAETHLRAAAAARASLQINHLLVALSQNANTENQQVLSQILLQQQQQFMRINPAIPFAAIIVDPPTAEHYPSSPQPFLYILGALVVTGLVTALIAAWRASIAWTAAERRSAALRAVPPKPGTSAP